MAISRYYEFAEKCDKIEANYCEIATPVCGLVRNDMVDDMRAR